MRTLLRAHLQKPGRVLRLFIYLFNIAMACRGARGCSATGAHSCFALHSPERHGWEHEKQQSLGWTRTEPHGHILLPGLGLSHTATYFCRCGSSMMPRSFLSPAALVWDRPGGYHKGKTPVPAENWAFWDTSTQSAPKIPVPRPWKDKVPPHGNTSLPRKSSPAFGGHGRAKGRCRISISTYVGRAGG